jgi:hypothetical protein
MDYLGKGLGAFIGELATREQWPLVPNYVAGSRDAYYVLSLIRPRKASDACAGNTDRLQRALGLAEGFLVPGVFITDEKDARVEPSFRNVLDFLYNCRNSLMHLDDSFRFGKDNLLHRVVTVKQVLSATVWLLAVTKSWALGLATALQARFRKWKESSHRQRYERKVLDCVKAGSLPVSVVGASSHQLVFWDALAPELQVLLKASRSGGGGGGGMRRANGRAATPPADAGAAAQAEPRKAARGQREPGRPEARGRG